VPRCPKCGAEIDYLLNYCMKTVTFIVELTDGDLDYIKEDEYPDSTENRYMCPVCGRELFTNEEDAKAFLRQTSAKEVKGMTKFYVDGAGWNGSVSRVCVVERDAFDQGNYANYLINYEFELTNNEAEYYAVIEALKLAKPGDIICTDSALVVNQVLGRWKINYERLRNLQQIIRAILKVKPVEIRYVPREENCAGLILERR